MIVPFVDVRNSLRYICETHEKLGVDLSMRARKKIPGP